MGCESWCGHDGQHVDVRRFRCSGDTAGIGCGAVFEADLDARMPASCPFCGDTFCGSDCCGNIAEELCACYVGPGMYEPPQAWTWGVHGNPP